MSWRAPARLVPCTGWSAALSVREARCTGGSGCEAPWRVTLWSPCRLYMLEEQCNTWGGITSVAVYLPLVYFQSVNDKKLQEAISHVEDFHEQIDRTHGMDYV